jgi:hypothetical protein
MSATDFKVVLGFHTGNKQAYMIIRDDVVAYAIQHGITGVDMYGPESWGLFEEHAIAHKYLAGFRAAFRGTGPEEYTEHLRMVVKCLCIDPINKKNAVRRLANNQMAENSDFEGPAAAGAAVPRPVPGMRSISV